MRRTMFGILAAVAVVAKLLGHSTTRMVELVYGHLSTHEYKAAMPICRHCRARHISGFTRGDSRRMRY